MVGDFFYFSPTYIVETKVLTEPGAQQLASLADQNSPMYI